MEAVILAIYHDSTLKASPIKPEPVAANLPGKVFSQRGGVKRKNQVEVRD
jgi:hypothetical protein